MFPVPTAAAIALAFLLAGTPNAAGQSQPAVKWGSCPAYSDEVIRARGFSDAQIPKFRVLLSRMECGKVSVPLDYRKPRGRQITIAITRLKAVDRAHRLGSLALNPGGPGGSGYVMPIEIILMNATNAQLNDRYDLIGIDPRGVGFSTKVNCPPPGGKPPAPGPLTKEAAKSIYDSEVATNKACGRSDPGFLGRLTTVNMARDLDRVRAALGERKLDFFGVSWGTWLGAVYRSTFPGNVGRMFLDSVALPRFRLDDFEDGRAAAAERDFSRMAAWIARHHDTYGFGTTAKKVRTAILALGRAYDETPKRYTDVAIPADGGLVAMLASQGSLGWPRAAKALKELREDTGTTAPPTVKEFLSGGPQQPPPADAPEQLNMTTSQVVFCNEDPSRLGFSKAWTAYQRRLEQNPVTGRAGRFSAGCAGWPLPAQKVRVHRTAGSLVLSGHRYEAISPYEWTTQMRSAIGGKVFTVKDDMHGSVLRECPAGLVSYFTTGRIAKGCDGAATP
ncbi:alpha/beta fold hydrolase [Nonomuraea sp. NEAU-A123]|uniref:alpha/beta fold hydrolase n=1 Tax=Nonomuraea sp. NEAU-A123 TaxID=2839649 RepID=UPI001BE43528|nr:alpha/beta fold hydrolase [Nonomuraea sp. NEAU-A123]MBT2231245.1 alpha/beta hydrolase [Nonomuraea sp. NEAU-A123]